jgi:hypothetical protein
MGHMAWLGLGQPNGSSHFTPGAGGAPRHSIGRRDAPAAPALLAARSCGEASTSTRHHGGSILWLRGVGAHRIRPTKVETVWGPFGDRCS